MDILLSQTSQVLFGFGVLLGVVGVVVGGTMFFSVPLFLWLFPEASFGALVGNLKVGSFFRGIGSTLSTFKQIQWKSSLLISVPPFLATILGASFIANLDQKWMLPAVIIAVILAELAPKIAHLVSQKNFYIASSMTGVYAGVFGAGIGIILTALLRLKYPKDSDIALVKIQARFIEWVLVITAVVTHFLHKNLFLEIWLPWALGGLVGGVLGGLVLKKIGHASGHIQKLILRFSFALAILIALIKFL